MKWRVREWTAVSLGLIHPPLALLYLDCPAWALVYELGFMGAGIIEYFTLKKNSYPLQSYFPLATLFFVPGIFHAFWKTTQNHSHAHRAWFSRWYGIVFVAVGMSALMFVVDVFVFSIYRESSDSMLPSIPKEASLVVRKWGYGNYEWHGYTVLRRPPAIDFLRGDVVVFYCPSNRKVVYVKRVVGLPGDRIQCSRAGLFVNGLLQTKEEVNATTGFHLRRETLGNGSYEVLFADVDQIPNFETIVPPWHLFVLGDNRDRSLDSRYWGPIPIWDFIGKVVYIRK